MSALTEQKKKPYKIVLEAVTQEKKKLRTIDYYDIRAPPGYTYVPVGISHITELCKEACRQKGLIVFVVSKALNGKVPATFQQDPQHIAHHVHRLGHHFRNDIVERACKSQGQRIRGHVDAGRQTRTTTMAQRLDTHGHRLGVSNDNASLQRNGEQVRDAIKELFPEIPDHDLNDVVARAFEEGTGRVGNAKDIPLPRRVQLAVVAHIRHNYTNYDQLWKVVGWQLARKVIEQPCLDQIMKWRGEGASEVELEEIFQEVIVLDDDDDDNDDDDDDDEDEEIETRTQSQPAGALGHHQPDVNRKPAMILYEVGGDTTLKLYEKESPSASLDVPIPISHVFQSVESTAPSPRLGMEYQGRKRRSLPEVRELVSVPAEMRRVERGRVTKPYRIERRRSRGGWHEVIDLT